MIDDVRPVKKAKKPALKSPEININDASQDNISPTDADSFLTPEQMSALDEAEKSQPIGNEKPKTKQKPKIQIEMAKRQKRMVHNNFNLVNFINRRFFYLA
jgi:hypothetical protein